MRKKKTMKTNVVKDAAKESKKDNMYMKGYKMAIKDVKNKIRILLKSI